MKRIKKSRNTDRQLRHKRVRAKIKGTESRPRLSVFRGLRSISAQLIDDEKNSTLCSVSDREIKDAEVKDKTGKVKVAYLVGQEIATKAKAKKIENIVFDRAGYKYHGRVAALAEGARDGGLKF